MPGEQGSCSRRSLQHPFLGVSEPSRCPQQHPAGLSSSQSSWLPGGSFHPCGCLARGPAARLSRPPSGCLAPRQVLAAFQRRDTCSDAHSELDLGPPLPIQGDTQRAAGSLPRASLASPPAVRTTAGAGEPLAVEQAGAARSPPLFLPPRSAWTNKVRKKSALELLTPCASGLK